MAAKQNQQIEIQIEGKNISQVENANSLGVFISPMDKNFHEISKRISTGIGALERLRPSVSLNAAKMIYESLIQPHFDHCCTVWDGSKIVLLGS